MLVIAVGLVLSLSHKVRSLEENGPPVDSTNFQLNGSLLSPDERVFLATLDKAMYPDFRVFAKPRLSDFILPLKDLHRHDWENAYSQIKSRGVDFLICVPGHVRPVCAFRFDRKYRISRRQLERDVFLEDIFATIGLPLIRMPDDRRVTLQPDQVRELVFNAMTEFGIPTEWPIETEVEHLPSA